MLTGPGGSRTWRQHLVKLARYGAVSALFTGVSFLALALLVGVLAFPAGWANFLVAAVAIPPRFELNRRWVWSHSAGPWWTAPGVLPFTIFSLAAVGISTLAVHVVGLEAAHWSRTSRTGAIEIAAFSSLGFMLMIQYFVLDRILAERQMEESIST